MSPLSVYKAFLASPSPDALAADASLHYIPTLTSIHDSLAIMKHLTVQEKLLKKKDQKVLSVVEGSDALTVDVETTLLFNASGGAYLPGLDDNFVADRTVTFPVLHVVHMNNQGKIAQIRLYWDQGSLLKQIDVIGARARNWPIRDGREQSQLIAASSAAIAQPETAPSSRRSTTARGPDEISVSQRPSRSRSSTENAMNDPHASLALFQPRDVNQEGASAAHPTVPRVQSAKPSLREYSELFVGADSGSPSPANASIPSKLGAGKNHKVSRIFDETQDENAAPTPQSVKTNAKKYDHFDFGEGDNHAAPKMTARSRHAAKNDSHWDFEDFVTPEKPKPKILGQAVRHFGWSDDEEEESPVRQARVIKPRPDADAHFDFEDDGTPKAQQKKAPTKGRLGNKGMGLYQDHVVGSTAENDQNGASKGDTKQQDVSDVNAQVRAENRQKDFGAQWEMNDDSPATDKAHANHSKLTHNQQKVLSTLDAQWGLYEESPGVRGIKTAGNGMGARKGTDASWSLYEDSPADRKEKQGGKKQQGNGMGGRQGTGFDWDF